MSDFFASADLDAQRTKDQEASDSTDWEPADGEAIQAILLKKRVVKTRFGNKLVFVVRNVGDEASGGLPAGESGNMWVSNAVLKRKMLEMMPKVGTGMAIRHEGMVSPEGGGTNYRDYTVLIEEGAPNEWVGLEQKLDEDTREDRQTQPNAYGGGNQQAPAQADTDWQF